LEAFKISMPTRLPSLIIVENNPRLVLVTLFNGSAAEFNGVGRSYIDPHKQSPK
jgi:hypothetical protein